MEQEWVALGHSVCAPLLPTVRSMLHCSKWPQQDCPGDQGGGDTGCSALHSQSSPMVYYGLPQITLEAGPSSEGEAGAGWLLVRLAAQF